MTAYRFQLIPHLPAEDVTAQTTDLMLDRNVRHLG